MPQKLAIAISGAVSLGSYESGVIYEIVEAIAQHNESSKTTDAQKIEIDVITGASAGAMTACILAQKLLFEADNLRDPYDNHLFRPWVKDVDLRKLIKFQPEDDPNMSILSSSLVEKIGNDYLLERYKGLPLERKRHPAAAATLHLGIAMSNLNGFDFKINLANIEGQLNSDNDEENTFTYTRHQDRYITQIQGTAQDDNRELWELIKQIGISSGAFPFAFKVQEIERQSSDPIYKDSVIYESGLHKFSYTDGGVFENEPLGMAKSIARQLDIHPRDYETRFFLYIAPGSKSSQITKDFCADNADYVNTARALTGAIFTQARFQDWIGVSETNQSIQQLDFLALRLKNFFTHHPEPHSELNEVAEQLLAALYSDDNPTMSDDALQIRQPNFEEIRQDDNNRLKEQFTDDFQELSSKHGEALANSWLKAVQVLEKATNLGSKDLMVVYAITAKDEELASEKLSAFGGFFDERFRDYDYYIGRLKASQFLQQLKEKNRQGQQKNQLFLINFEAGKNLQQPFLNLGDVELDKVDFSLRLEVKKLLLERLGRIINSLEKRKWVALLIKLSLTKFLEKELDKLLKI